MAGIRSERQEFLGSRHLFSRAACRMSQHGSAPARLSTSTAPAPALGLRWRWPALGSQHAALGAGNSCAGARLRWRWSALALGRSALALGIPALALSCAGAGLRWRWGRSALALGFLRWRWAALPLTSLSQYVPVTTVSVQFSFSFLASTPFHYVQVPGPVAGVQFVGSCPVGSGTQGHPYFLA